MTWCMAFVIAPPESWLKRVLTQGYYRILNLSSPIDIPESAGDFRLLDAKVVEAIKQLPEKIAI